MGMARSGQKLAPAGSNPRDRREQYRSKWAVNTSEGLTAPPPRGALIKACALAPAAWRYSRDPPRLVAGQQLGR
jgi:hypothetical protein